MSSRRLRVAVVVLAVLAVLGGAVAWALPEIVRRVAVAQIPKVLDRAVSIEDVDLNLFTRRLAVKHFRLADRDGAGDFIRFERLDLRFSYWALVRSDVRLTELRLNGLAVHVLRTGAAEFNFSDIIEKFAKPEPAKPPSRWTFTIDDLGLADASIEAVDRHVVPAATWRIDGLGIQGTALTTRPGQPPGTLRLDARLNAEATVALAADAVGLAPPAVSAHFSLTGFDLARVRPYLPPELPASPTAGTLGVSLVVAVERAGDELRKATVSGDVRVDALSVVQRDHGEPFLSVPHVGVAIKEADLVARTATAAVEVDGVDLKANRSRTGEIDLLAALAPSGSTPPADARPAPEPAGEPAARPFALRLDRLALRSGVVTLEDGAVSPPHEWKLDGVSVEAAALSNSAADPPGTFTARARILSRPGHAKPATVTIQSDSLKLVPLAASVRLALAGFDLTSAVPYLPGDVPARPSKGILGVDLSGQVERGDAGLTRATASGSVRLNETAVVQRGATEPFLTLPKLVVGIKQADALAHVVSLARVEIDGVGIRAVRDAEDHIDLLGLLAPTSAAAGAPSAAAPRPAPSTSATTASATTAAQPAQPAQAASGGAGAWRLSLDHFALTKGTATFEDHAVMPASTLAVTDLTVAADRLSWPPTTSVTLTASMTMPGGGRTEIKGAGTIEPLNVQLKAGTHDAPIEPYQSYFPFDARFFGLFSGDSVSEIQRAADGTLILASRGTASGRDMEIRAPGVDTPVARMVRMEIKGIDFSWPNYALVDKVTLTRPEAQIERDRDGVINLRQLFEPRRPGAAAAGAPRAETAPTSEAKPPAAAGSDAAAGEPHGGLMQSIVLDFNEIRIEDGFFRFLDRTTTPAFSEDISKLTLVVNGLSNVLGRQRTTMSVQALVGGDAALDMRGELSKIGEAFHADLVGELRDFALTSANPYADSLTSWIVQRGKLTAKVHYRVDGDQLSGDHDVKFTSLNVERSRAGDEVKQRLGLPLGLVVALLKDSHGDIDFAIPLTGNLADRKFDWGAAMWTAIKQVIFKVLAAPFHAIGRVFTGGGKVEELAINPVTFEPGSSVVAPSAELQITRVADFLRRSPYVKLELTPMVTAADARDLKARAVRERLEQFQKEQGLPDLTAAVRAYYQQRAPDLTLPKTVDEQMALLRDREPEPTGPLADLQRRRLDNVRDRLVKTEGIPADRVMPAAAAPPVKEASGEGRVEFGIQPG
jgi:hypothetical protein